MIAEVGHFLLIAALFITVCQSLLPLLGSYGRLSGSERLMSSAPLFAKLQLLLLTAALLLLITLFLQDDFTVSYVAGHSNSFLPVWYKVSAVWGGHEGSLLFWAWVMAAWTGAVAFLGSSLPKEVLARVLAVMGMIAVGFVSFMLFTSNPFVRLLPDFPVDGGDLNPLLQDIGLIIHPPMLYMGYVGFSVAFAFAIEGLISGRLDSAWARWSRPWTTAAWCFLTLGIALGSWWAYYELGWGGWWFWDPVENASLMPWLAGTALMHSLAVTEKRGVFKAWTVLLAITAFSLSLLGTFLVRSGVLTSVHAFASDPERGLFILAFLLLTVGGSLTLFAFRAHLFNTESRYELFSREVMLLLNNLIFAVALVAVLLGTLFPLIADVLNMGKISVGPPYFNFIFVPLTFLLMAVLGVGVVTQWKRQRWRDLVKPVVVVGLISLVVAGVTWIYFDEAESISSRARTALAFLLVAWVLLFNGWDWYKKASNSKKGLFDGARRLRRSYYGMLTAHLGLGVMVIGITMTSLFSIEKDVRMEKGQSLSYGGYEFTFHGVDVVEADNYTSDMGYISVKKGSAANAQRIDLYPEKRNYWVTQSIMTEASIDAGVTRDLYVALGEALTSDRSAWAVRLYLKPYVRWIWGGALLMALGGVLALLDRRYRLRSSATA